MRFLCITLVLAILTVHISARNLKKKIKPPRVRQGDEDCSPCDTDAQPADPWGDVWGSASDDPAPVEEPSDEDAVPSGGGWSSDDDGGTPADGGWSSDSAGGWPSDSANQGESPAPGDTADQPCTCMSVLQCGGSLRAGVGDDSEENVCPNEGDVCCVVESTGKPPDEPSNSGSSLQCGQARPSIPSISLSDTQAQFGELPWTVLLTNGRVGADETGAVTHRCAGTLINERVIVTAAHCVSRGEDTSLVVRAGDWDLLDQSTEPLPHQEREVEKVIIHPDYKKDRVPHNIAIVLLTEPFDLADNVNPICLPQKYLDEVDSTNCVASGWGYDPEGNKNNILKKVNVGIVGRKQCRDALRSTQLGKYFVLDQSSICAGGENGRDTCQGDGGGPLACPSKSTGAMTLVGITSWGVKCGMTGIPGIYSDILAHISWITDTLSGVV